MVEPVPFIKLFRYASREDLIMLFIGNIFILYSSLNIPLVNIVYGLMMREMNDFVARRSASENITSIIDNSLTTITPTTLDSLIPTTTTSISPLPTPSPLLATLDTLTSSFTTTSTLVPTISNNISATTTTQTPFQASFNGTLEDAERVFITNSYNLCMTVILFGATRFVALYIALLFFSIAASNQAKRVKKLFFASLLRQEVAWFERNRTGDFAIRITSDLSKFEDGIGEKIALCLNALFAWMSSLISSFYYGWELTLVCLVLVPLTIFTTTVIAQFQATYSIRESAALSRAFNVCHEAISSIRTVLSFSGQQKEADRFKKGLDSAYKHGLKRNMFGALNLGFTWMSGYLGFAICLLYSTKFYTPEYYGKYDEARIVTILWSAAGCVFLLNRMMPFIEIIQMARGSAANIFAVIERKSQIDVTADVGLKPRNFEANVSFKNVSFTYPNTQEQHAEELVKEQLIKKPPAALATGSPNKSTGQPIIESSGDEGDERTTTMGTSDSEYDSGPTIRGMSMEIKSGQTIALVGPSGSGKSTALALLQRFYDIDEGEITLGGHKLKELNLAWLRGQFGVVTQEPVLFDMSIGDNIRLGGHPGQALSDYDVEQAARSANAHAFIVRLPNGYETRVGTRGVQLSGGQKQRISIARALIRQPKILLLDEATSALDLESESIVQRALDQARIGRTTFIVAHRLSTVRNADKIIVFDKGTIVESGTHEELIKKRGLYYQIGAQQRQGIDLLPPTVRRNSQIGPAGHHLMGGGGGGGGGGGVGLPGAGGVGIGGTNTVGNVDHHQYTSRESRSLSIYSTAGGFGAAGHGGNGEGVDNGSCCAGDEPANKFATDDDYYNRNEEDESDSASGNTRLPLLDNPDDGTQASLLDDGDSLTSLLLGANQAGGKFGRPSSSLSVLNVLRFIKPDPTYSMIGIFASLLMGLCIPISAMIIGNIATQFSRDNPETIRAGLFSHGLLYIGLAMFAFCVSFIQVVSFGVAGEKIGLRLRLRGFEAILHHEMAWFDRKRNNPGSICGRLASDVGNVQSITGNRTAVIFQSISILLSTFVFAVYFNLKFSSICAMFVAILLTSTIFQSRYAAKLAITNRGFDSQIGKIVLESSANIKTVVSLHQEGYFIERCDMLLQKDRRSRSLDNHLRLSLESLKYAMTAISKGSSFYFAAQMLLRNEITIDVIFKLIEIILYGLTEASKSLIFISDLEKARRGTQNLYKLVYGATAYPRGGGGDFNGGFNNNNNNTKSSSKFLAICSKVLLAKNQADNVVAQQNGLRQADGDCKEKNLPTLQVTTSSPTLMNYQNNITAYRRSLLPPTITGSIKFANVRFHYPARPDACVLKSLSVDIAAGKSVALVGRSGCGKSTVVQILERFYNYSQGQILLDGMELQALPNEWVRSQIALVSQEPSLLSYTIGDNIRYGDNSRYVPMDEVVKAAQVANIHDFIMSLPDQYDTQLSESNSLQLSGGQKQRIAIARALVRKAPILVLDEATSALDAKSESVVQEALDRAQVGKTSIVIAHRLSTVKSADTIVVLKDGLVVEQGTHQELLDKRGEYYCLYKTQSH